MKKLSYGVLLAVVLVLSFLTGHWYSSRDPDRDTSLGRRILYYVDPMNPAHTSDRPGIAPCGMKMEPVYADEAQASGDTLSSVAPGTIRITPEKQQVIGVRTAVADKAVVTHTVRTVGRVLPDEQRTYRLVAGVDGWIKETYNDTTGTLVKKDEILATFYSPQFLTAQRAYIFALGSQTATPGSRPLSYDAPLQARNIQQYIDALEGLGMSRKQISELGETRDFTDKVSIAAPATGFVLSRNVSPGQRFDKGAEWYRIADLSRVWVLADLFRNDADYVKAGSTAKVTLPQQKIEFRATVSAVLPQFDATSRTLKVRLEMENPGFALKPDMFVDVEFPGAVSTALTIPSDAILDSGLMKTVFVDRGNGFFEPRQVETGRRMGESVEITRGLAQGERIVVSGNFLIDSESRMKMAGAGMQKASQSAQAGKEPAKPVSYAASTVKSGSTRAATGPAAPMKDTMPGDSSMKGMQGHSTEPQATAGRPQPVARSDASRQAE